MSCLVDIIEGMEKLVLSGLLAGDELDIVHEEKVDVAVLYAKLLRSAVLDGFDHLIGELVALDVGYLLGGVLLVDSLSDGEEKVGLAETGISVDEKGIVDLAGILADGDGGGMGEVVRVADDEAVEGVAGHVRQAVLGLFVRLVFADLVPGEY